MRLHRLDDIRLSSSDTVFRESPWARLIALVCCLALGAVPLFIALSGNASQTWPFYIAAAVMALIALVFARLFVKTLSPENWLVCIRPSGNVAIKFRSFANNHFPREDKIVLELDREEIQFARIHREDRRGYKSSHGSEAYKETRISVDLAVAPDLAAEIDRHLTAERARPAPQQGTFVKTRSRAMHFPVRIVESDGQHFVRVEWRANATRISPAADVALKLLGKVTRVQSGRTDTIDMTRLAAGSEADSRIRDLAERGEMIEAANLARRVYGISLTEARGRVDEMISGVPHKN